MNRYFLNIGLAFNDIANWSTTSGGAGGASVPVAGDIAIYDSNSGDCSFDINVDVLGLTTTGYTGTITQGSYTLNVGSSNINWDNGSFAGSNTGASITANKFIKTGGSFTSTNGLFQVGVAGSGLFSWDVTGGQFYHNNGSVLMFGANHSGARNILGYPLNHFETNQCGTCSNGGTLYVEGNYVNTLTSSASSMIVYLKGNYTQISGRTPIVFEGSNIQTIDATQISSTTINKTGGSLDVVQNMALNGSWTHTAGIINWNNAKLTVVTSANGTSITNGWFYDLESNITSGVTVGTAGTPIVVTNKFTGNHQAGAGTFPSVLVGGDLSILSAVGSLSTVTLNGSGTQNITSTANMTGHLIINKASGSVVLNNDFVIAGASNNCTVTLGEFNLNGFNFTMTNIFTITNKLKLKGNETITINGSGPVGNARFVLGAASTVEWFDDTITAVITNLSKTYFNIIFGENKIHEFASGVGNAVIINGFATTTGTNITRSILRTVADAAADWYMTLNGGATFTDTVNVKRCNAGAGLYVYAIGSADSGNNTNWIFTAADFIWLGTTNDLWDEPTNWSTNLVPLAWSNVILDASSPACTINVNSVCRSIDGSAYLNTLTHNAGFTLTIGDYVACPGNALLKFNNSMTYTVVDDATSALSFKTKVTIPQTIDFSGKTTANIDFNDVGWMKLLNHITGSANSIVSLTKGIFETNNFDITAGRFTSTNSNVRRLIFGSSNINLSGSGSNFFTASTVTNLTVDVNTATLNITKNGVGTAPLLHTGIKAWYFNINWYGGGIATIRGGTGSTFGTITVNGAPYTNSSEDRFQINESFISTGPIQFNGYGPERRMRVHSNNGAGSPRTITIQSTTSVTGQYVDFQGITLTQTNDLSAITGGAGDLGGNTGIIFSPSITCYWYSPTTGVKEWFDPANWYLGTGGTGGLARRPLPGDTAQFDANSFPVSGVSIECNRGAERLARNIYWDDVTNNPDWKFNIDVSAYGAFRLPTTPMTMNVIDGVRWFTFIGHGTSNTFLYTLSGKTLPHQMVLFNFLSNTNTVSINGKFSCKAIYIAGCVYQSNNYDHDIDSFYMTTGSTVNLGNGIWKVSGLAGVQNAASWFINSGTLNPNNSLIVMNNSTPTTTQTFNGSGRTYNELAFYGDANNTYIIIGNNSFAKIHNGKDSAYTVKFTAGSTQTVTNFNLQGSLGKEITVTSTTTSVFTLTKPSGKMFNNYLILSYSTVNGGALWYANNSNDVTTNTGWIFTGRTLYHKGGLTSSAANWSLSDGGAGGEPIPTPLDAVYFPMSSATDAEFDIDLVVREFNYNTTRDASGVGSITVYEDFNVTTDTSWAMTTALNLNGNISITSPTAFTFDMQVFIGGYNATIIGMDSLNKATNNLVNINKYFYSKLLLGSDIYLNKNSAQNTTLDFGVIDHATFNLYIGDSLIQNNGSVIGVNGFVQAQRFILNRGIFDPKEAKSNSTQNVTLFQDAALVTLFPSDGLFTFIGVGPWTIDQNYTEFNNVIIDKGSSSTQTGIVYARGDITIANNSKYGSFRLKGNFLGASNDVTGIQTFLGTTNQSLSFNGQMGIYEVNKATGDVVIDSGLLKIKGFNNISGAERTDYSSVITHVFTSNTDLSIWNVLGVDFGDLKIEVGGSNDAALGNDTKVYGTFTLELLQNLTGDIDLYGNLTINDTTIGGVNSIMMLGTAVQNITMPATGSVSTTISVNKVGGFVRMMSNFINTIATLSGFQLAVGIWDLNGYNYSTLRPVVLEDNTTLKLKGNETILINGLPSRDNPDFILGINITVEYYDNTVIALVDPLMSLFNRLILGAGKVHEFNPGPLNSIEIDGTLESSGTYGNWSILRSAGNVGDQWYLELTGVSILTDNVSVANSNANAGLLVSAIGSVDMNNNDNWHFGGVPEVPFDAARTGTSEDLDLLEGDSERRKYLTWGI